MAGYISSIISKSQEVNWYICKTNEHYIVLEQAILGTESSALIITLCYPDQNIYTTDITDYKVLHLLEAYEYLLGEWQ
jgi:hypothetical protein